MVNDTESICANLAQSLLNAIYQGKNVFFHNKREWVVRYADMELTEIINILQQEYPDKVIVDLSEYESEEHQTYKYLYEQLSRKYSEKLNEVGMLATDQQNYEKEIAELSQKMHH